MRLMCGDGEGEAASAGGVDKLFLLGPCTSSALFPAFLECRQYLASYYNFVGVHGVSKNRKLAGTSRFPVIFPRFFTSKRTHCRAFSCTGRRAGDLTLWKSSLEADSTLYN